MRRVNDSGGKVTPPRDGKETARPLQGTSEIISYCSRTRRKASGSQPPNMSFVFEVRQCGQSHKFQDTEGESEPEQAGQRRLQVSSDLPRSGGGSADGLCDGIVFSPRQSQCK